MRRRWTKTAVRRVAERVFIGTVVKASPCGSEATAVCAFCRRTDRVDTTHADGAPIRGEALRRWVGEALAEWRMAPVEIDGVPVIAGVCGDCCGKHGIR